MEKNARQRTIEALNLEFFDETDTAGRWQMPIIHREQFIPKELISFRYMKTPDKNKGVHCFAYDSEIDRIWKAPEKYIEKLSGYACFLSPDYSLYLDMPAAQKIYNVFRSRLIGHFYQSLGMTVIPTVQWADVDSFDYCFDGIEAGGTIAVSDVGCKRDKNATRIWKLGMDETIKRLDPKTILYYGSGMDYDFKGREVVYYPEDCNKWRAENGQQRK